MKYILASSVFFIPVSLALAHTATTVELSTSATFLEFLYQGIRHIIPLGLDHILFITTIFLLSRSLLQIVKYSLIFTLAHSVTLSMMVLGVFSLPGEIVEPIIAFSIFLLAVDLIRPFIAPHMHGVVIFVFGLFHGFGFAGVLTELGLPENQLVTSLFGFNVGVEIGQLMMIGLLYFVTLLPFKNESSRKNITFATALVIALIAGFWCIERTLL